MTSEPDRGRGPTAGVTRYDYGHLARQSASSAVATVSRKVNAICPGSTS